MTAYHIKQWDELYERADTRKVDFMPWYPKQTKLMGIGIGHTMAQADNLELLGLWALLETLASQSKKFHRGWLVRNGRPLTPETMSALLPQVPAAKFRRALEHFASAEVDWLEVLPWQAEALLPGLLKENEMTGKRAGENPGNLPSKDGNSRTVGDSRENLPVGSRPTAQNVPRQERTGRNSATDRQTDRQSTDRQTDNNNKSSAVASVPESGENPPSLAAVTASKIQFAATKDRIGELSAIKQSRALNEAEREEWKKLRDSLKGIQKKQRAGKF